jgi:nitrilase
MRVSLIQMNSGDDKAENIKQAASLIAKAVDADHPDMVVLPEYFSYLGENEGMRGSAEPFPDGDAYSFARDTARKHNVLLHVGSTMESTGDGKFYNSTLVIDAAGEELARYRKIHLFDIDTPDGDSYRESDIIDRGGEIVSYRYRGKVIGCTICYDIRFAELYARLAQLGADIITVPAAFTLETGKDHWEVLCRARAIETQAFLLAAAQIGFHMEGGTMRACFGNSMIVDPWGQVIGRTSNQIGHVTAELDFEYQVRVRRLLPVARHHVLT